MTTKQKALIGMVMMAVVFSMAGCAGMSRQGQNTMVGAGVGAVGGAVLTGGSPLGTIGGAAVGGLVGHSMH
jgi:osmotically inducible lipoprotein OsmB